MTRKRGRKPANKMTARAHVSALKWKKNQKVGLIDHEYIPKLDHEQVELPGKSEFEIFCEFYDGDIRAHIIHETRRYATQRNDPSFAIDFND